MSNFPLSEAELVAFFMESAAWGVQLVTATICVYTLVSTSKASKRRVNVPLLIWVISLFAVGTTDIAFALYRNIYAFTMYQGEGGSDLIFSQLSDYVTVLRGAWNFLAILIADAALIQRCWVIYGRTWVYVIPSIIIWLAGLACAAGQVYYCATFNALTNLAGAQKVEDFLNAFVVLDVALNIITTTLILYRIDRVHRNSSRYLSKRTGSSVSSRIQWSELTRILVESASIYTLTSIIVLVVNFSGSNAVYPLSDFNLQLAGIQFDLILIRVGRGIAVEHVDTSLQTMQFNLPPLNGSTQRSGAQATVTEDTNLSTDGLRSFSDVESKQGANRSMPDTVRITGIDDDYV